MVEQDILILRQQVRELKHEVDKQRLLFSREENKSRSSEVKIGQVIDRQGDVPTDYLVLDGSSYQGSAYPALHSALSKIVGYRTVTSDSFTLPNTGELVKAESTELVITSSGSLVWNHELGVLPDFLFCFVKNISAEIGFVVGERINLTPWITNNLPTAARGAGVTLGFDTVKVNIRFGSATNVFEISKLTATIGDTVVLANTKWVFVVRAFAIKPTKMIRAR